MILSPQRILAISSSGGHWEQMMLIRSAFADAEVHYATTMPGLSERAGAFPCTIVEDFNARSPIKILKGAGSLAKLIKDVRPDVIISTGAAPGVVAIVLGKLRGAKTIWLDSVANVERVSLSGRIAAPFADLWLTQWEHLSGKGRPSYQGAVL